MKIMLSAGEASGDLNGAHLARALLAREPGLELFGMGGPLMAEAGVEILHDPTEMSTVGFLEVLRSAGHFRRLLRCLGEEMARRRPDCLVVIDFPGFNMRLGKLAKARSVPVVYYFGPQAWAWGRGRARAVAQHAALVCAVFPFEAELYREAGARVEYVGHPLVDTVKPRLALEEAAAALGVAGAWPVISLLPGSRRQELEHHLKPMLQAASILKRRFQGARFILPLAHTVDRRQVEAGLPGEVPVQIAQGMTYEALAFSHAAMAAIGTVTLEAALLGCPFVGVLRLSPSTYWMARRLYKPEYTVLPNIVAGREIVPELIQEDATPERIAEEVARLLEPGRREEVLAGFREVRERLGGPGAVERAAAAVLQVAAGRGES